MDDLRKRAEIHAKRFKTFSVEAFLAWFTEHSAGWQNEYAQDEIKDLQRKRRWENYQLAEYYRDRRNTVHIPPID